MSHSPDIPGAQDTEIFRVALEVLSTGVALLDRQRKIIFWNDGAEKITGYHRHDAVGHTIQANILGSARPQELIWCARPP